MKDTIIVDNFMLFYFDEKYSHVKINIYADCSLSTVFQYSFSTLRGNAQTGEGVGEGFLVYLLTSSPSQSRQVSILQQFLHFYFLTLMD